MQLNLVVERLSKKATKLYISENEIAQLTNAINKHGIRAVRKELKALRNGKTCPPIVKIEQSNQYYFKHNLYSCYIDNDPQYLTYKQLTHMWEQNYQDFGKDSNKDYHFSTTRDNLINDYPLSLWIVDGKECPDCGTPFINQTETLCSHCQQKYNIRSYNHKVEDELGFEETTHTRFGIELEYENVTKDHVFNNLKGHALPKSDGSIRSGVEVVTKPACIATHKTALTPFFTNVTTKRASNTGMHIHIERAKLSEYQIGFIQEFLNHPDLLKKNIVIAGRDY